MDAIGNEELSSYQHYDYLAKVILIGPSGCGKYVCSLIIDSEHAFSYPVQVLLATSICERRVEVSHIPNHRRRVRL